MKQAHFLFVSISAPDSKAHLTSYWSPLLISHEVIAVVESSAWSSTGCWISADLTPPHPHPLTRRVKYPGVQRFPPTPSFLFPLKTMLRFDVARTLLRRDASFNNRGGDWQMKAFIPKRRMRSLHPKWEFFLAAWKTLPVLLQSDWW